MGEPIAIYLGTGFLVAVAILSFFAMFGDGETTYDGHPIPGWKADFILGVAITLLWPAALMAMLLRIDVMGFRFRAGDDDD